MSDNPSALEQQACEVYHKQRWKAEEQSDDLDRAAVGAGMPILGDRDLDP
ncbi:MAG: hypothetical protein ACPGVO_01560 [Spirulinaceae cyanobacterium]